MKRRAVSLRQVVFVWHFIRGRSLSFFLGGGEDSACSADIPRSDFHLKVNYFIWAHPEFHRGGPAGTGCLSHTHPISSFRNKFTRISLVILPLSWHSAPIVEWQPLLLFAGYQLFAECATQSELTPNVAANGNVIAQRSVNARTACLVCLFGLLRANSSL